MAQIIADRRDVDFVLYEQLNIEKLSENEKYADFNKKTIDLIVSEARNLAIKEILPTQEASDREGARFDGGKVTVPESFHKAYALIKEGEWVAMTEDVEYGGQGMPRTLALAASDYQWEPTLHSSCMRGLRMARVNWWRSLEPRNRKSFF